MLNIMRAIAQPLGLQTKPSGNLARQTPTAGLVHRGLTQPYGNKRSVVATKLHKSSLAPKKPSSKLKVAQLITAESLRKPAQKYVQVEFGQSGKQRKTPVRRTHQHAK